MTAPTALPAEPLAQSGGPTAGSEAEFSRRLERFDSNQGWVSDGNASTAGWLSEHCRIARSTAWQRVRQARRLSELPGTPAALGAGEPLSLDPDRARS